MVKRYSKQAKKGLISVKNGCLYIASIVLLLLGIFIYIWPHIAIVEMSYQLENLKAIQSQLESNTKLLRLEIAALSSLSRIEELANKRYGLIPTQGKDIFYMKRNRDFYLAFQKQKMDAK